MRHPSAVVLLFMSINSAFCLMVKIGHMSMKAGLSLNGPAISMALADFMEKEGKNFTQEIEFR